MALPPSIPERTSGAPGRRARCLANEYVAAATPLQRVLAGLWADLLDVESVGIHDDFFELGGHSLLAAELLDALSHELGVAVPARTLYLQPTIAELETAMSGPPAAASTG